MVSAVAVATGGTAVLIPLIYKGITGGAIAGGMSAIGQKAAGGKVDWKKAGSTALKGAAGGMALGGLGKLAGSAMGATDQDYADNNAQAKQDISQWEQEQDQDTTDNSPDNTQAKQDINNWQNQQDQQDQQGDQQGGQQGGQQDQQGDQQQDPNGAETADDGSVTDDEFKKYTGTNPDPKSYQDDAIKQAFQNLKSKSGGQLGAKDADKASEQIIKFIRANKNIKDPNQIISQAVPWTLGESVYTAQYLRFF